jgi:hypothetical protein
MEKIKWCEKLVINSTNLETNIYRGETNSLLGSNVWYLVTIRSDSIWIRTYSLGQTDYRS